jgi:hypothetical protein
MSANAWRPLRDFIVLGRERIWWICLTVALYKFAVTITIIKRTNDWANDKLQSHCACLQTYQVLTLWTDPLSLCPSLAPSLPATVTSNRPFTLMKKKTYNYFSTQIYICYTVLRLKVSVALMTSRLRWAHGPRAFYRFTDRFLNSWPEIINTGHHRFYKET